MEFDFTTFVDKVGLRPLEQLVLSSALLSAAINRKELVTQALVVVAAEFHNGVLALCQRPCFEHADLTPAHGKKAAREPLF